MMTNSAQCAPAGGAEAYLVKNAAYYANARADYVAEFPVRPEARILEVGCGAGATGAMALAERKCGWYSGVDICEPATAIARERISEVLTGDVERMEFPWGAATFDGLIMSEVLEHLVDPWATLRRLRPLLKSGALVFASSPNASHYTVVRMLACARWDLEDKGIMDRTHLRWFTFISYRAMFESAGFVVDRVKPLVPLGPKARIVDVLTMRKFKHLLVRQLDLRGHCK